MHCLSEYILTDKMKCLIVRVNWHTVQTSCFFSYETLKFHISRSCLPTSVSSLVFTLRRSLVLHGRDPRRSTLPSSRWTLSSTHGWCWVWTDFGRWLRCCQGLPRAGSITVFAHLRWQTARRHIGTCCLSTFLRGLLSMCFFFICQFVFHLLSRVDQWLAAISVSNLGCCTSISRTSNTALSDGL